MKVRPKKRRVVGAFAQFFGGPGRRQAIPLLLALGVPGKDGTGTQGGVNPGDQFKTPIARIKTDHARPYLEEPHGPSQEWAGKRRIVDIGRRE